MFGEVREPQTEMTPFHPRSPYGCAKVFGHYITMNYRESYDMFVQAFCLTMRRLVGNRIRHCKITNAVARIKLGLQDEIVLKSRFKA